MPVIEIDDLNDARLDIFRHLNRGGLTCESERFVAEGRWVVERLLASQLRTESIICAGNQTDFLRSVDTLEIPTYVLTPEQVSSLVGFQFHRGVLACGVRPAYPSLADLVHPPEPYRNVVPAASTRSVIVACPDVADPSNVAGIVRNCAAFGARGLLLSPRCADPFSRRVVRVSMGNVFHFPIRVSEDLAGEISQLRSTWDYQAVATVLDEAADPLPAITRAASRIVLLFGSEGYGLGPEWLALSDRRVTLPMSGRTDSLNIATANGIFLYHLTQIAES